MKGFSNIVAPLTTLLQQKYDSIKWTFGRESSFLNLENALSLKYVLTIMDLSKGNIVLWTNASDLAICGILMQDK